jgi:hypothetical protein
LFKDKYCQRGEVGGGSCTACRRRLGGWLSDHVPCACHKWIVVIHVDPLAKAEEVV